MKFKARPLALSFLGLLCTSAAMPVLAASIIAVPGDTYIYTFNLPAFSDGTVGGPDAAQFSITFINGAFGTTGSRFYNYSYTGSPLGDGSAPFVSWTTALDAATDKFDLPEMLLEYPDTSSDVTSFLFIASESVWATAGSDLSFNYNGTTPYALLYINPFDTYEQTWGSTNLGASYATTVDGVTDDPPLDNVMITITATPDVAATPEPSTLLMIGTGLVGFAGMMRRKMGMHRQG